MRLTPYQQTVIKQLTTDIFGMNTHLMLFGSRVNDAAKGDLYIETLDSLSSFDKKIKLLTALQRALGEQKIDIVVNDFTKDKEIYRIAKQTGIVL